MSQYEHFVNVFLAENDIFTESQAASVFGSRENCDIITQYFKVRKVKTNIRGRCIFETSDGIQWTFLNTMYDDKLGTRGLLTRVQFANENKKFKINGQPIKMPDGSDVKYFNFYFHYDENANVVFVNDPKHVPWYNFKGEDWCGQNPFGHGCWNELYKFDNNAILPWQYIKMTETNKPNYNDF